MIARAGIAVGLVVAMSACGCATSVVLKGRHATLLNHALYVDNKGVPAKLLDRFRQPIVGPEERDPRGRFSEALFEARNTPRLPPYIRIASRQLGMIVAALRDSLAAGTVDEVVLVIHGGRNTLAGNLDAQVEWLEKIRAERRGAFPIFINYESEDVSSYVEHLFYTRPAQRGLHERAWRWWRWPLSLVNDVGQGVARVPVNLYQHVSREFGATFPGELRVGDCLDSAVVKEHFRLPKGTRGQGWFEFGLGLASLASRAPADALVGTMGPGEWESMKRRSQVMLQLDHSYIPGLQHDEGKKLCSLDGNFLPGSVGHLLRDIEPLLAATATRPRVPVSIIAHSTGAIVACNLVSHPLAARLRFKDIVFMAAACTIDDFDSKLRPILERDHGDGPGPPRFFNLCLHPTRELQEFGFPASLFLRGTLLAWIDDFLAAPGSFRERTLGRAENCVPYFSTLKPGVLEHCFVRVFDYAGGAGESRVPVRHSDFMRTEMAFWKESFWGFAPAAEPPDSP